MPKVIINYVKYPFLTKVDELLRKHYGPLTLEDIILLNRSADYISKAVERIVAALKGRQYNESSSTINEVLSFYISILISSLISPALAKRVVLFESKRAYENLVKEKNDTLTFIGRKLGLNIKYLGVCANKIITGFSIRDLKPIEICLDFSVSIPDYLRYSKRLSGDPSWKLTNQFIKKGYVYMDKRRVARLLSEAIHQKISELIPKKTNALPQELNKFINEIKERIAKQVPEFSTEEGFKELIQVTTLEPIEDKEKIYEFKELIISSDKELQKHVQNFPPCVKEILKQLLRSENLSHHQRFALATFLININTDMEYILQLFSKLPDFNEKIARYQIEHLAGLRGSRKKYLPYNCATMKSLGICVANCGVKSPLTYFYKKYKKVRRQKTSKK